MLSPAQVLASLSDEEREEFMSGLTPEVLAQLKYDWNFWSRPNQVEPEGDWTTWLILAGRGFGKTRTGAEWVRANVLWRYAPLSGPLQTHRPRRRDGPRRERRHG